VPAAETRPDPGATRRLLRWVAIVAAIDTALLVPLVIGAVADNHGLTSVLGPIHGFGFLLELFLAALGTRNRMWGWWFPVLVIVTLGPLGALIGHRKVTRELNAAAAPA